MPRINKQIDFVGIVKIPIIISLAIFAIGLTINIIFKTPLDINFKGGVRLTYAYKGEIDTDDVEKLVEELLDENVEVSKSSNFAGTQHNIVISLAAKDSISATQQQKTYDLLTEKFPSNKIEIGETNSVDPSIGTKFFLKSLFTIFLAALFVTIYVGIRFRKIGGFSAGAAALVALFHDIIIAYLSFVILRIPLDDNFIAVVLTILGYSLNDTIVIYDRIREDRMKFGSRVPLSELVNASINKTLGRTLNTALATFLAVTTVTVVAFLMGLDSILSFTLPMSIGIISGSYSTIFLAGPLWVKWNEYRDKKRKAKKIKLT